MLSTLLTALLCTTIGNDFHLESRFLINGTAAVVELINYAFNRTAGRVIRRRKEKALLLKNIIAERILNFFLSHFSFRIIYTLELFDKSR